MIMFVFFFPFGLRPYDPGLFVFIILDGQMKSIGSQIGAVEFVFGQPSRASATDLLVIFFASAKVLPLAIWVSVLETAMAAPQPKVLNLMSLMASSSIFR